MRRRRAPDGVSARQGSAHAGDRPVDLLAIDTIDGRQIAFGLLVSTALPLVGAGLVSVLVFPIVAFAVRRTEPAPRSP